MPRARYFVGASKRDRIGRTSLTAVLVSAAVSVDDLPAVARRKENRTSRHLLEWQLFCRRISLCDFTKFLIPASTMIYSHQKRPGCADPGLIEDGRRSMDNAPQQTLSMYLQSVKMINVVENFFSAAAGRTEINGGKSFAIRQAPPQVQDGTRSISHGMFRRYQQQRAER